jgi:RNA polymerase sigma-70 factor (ECF subfamily)
MTTVMQRPTTADDISGEFERVALPHLGAVARFALSLARDAADADDLVQETFLRAFRGWHTYLAGSDARRWLFTICRNAFIRLQQRQARFVESDEGDLDALPAVAEHARAMSDGRLAALATLDVRPAILAAVDALPEPHHSILVLVDLEEHSYEEAAAVLEIPVGTVRSRLFRARRMVQASLLAHAEDAGLRPMRGDR